MKGKFLRVFIVASVLALAPRLSSAATIGFFLSFSAGSAAQVSGAITGAGYTPTQLTGLTATDLVGIDVLWILNGNNGTPDAAVTGNQAAILAFISAGGVLSFHDRNVAQEVDASNYLPGCGGCAFTTNFSTDIDVDTPNTPIVNGDFGVITNTTLDGGNLSNHGWASLASLPFGAVPVFNDGNPGQIVDFYYLLGLGTVYYSTIPIDFYLAGVGNDPPRTDMLGIYLPNELGFQVNQATDAVPEPASMLLFGTGLLALGMHVRARRKK